MVAYRTLDFVPSFDIILIHVTHLFDILFGGYIRQCYIMQDPRRIDLVDLVDLAA